MIPPLRAARQTARGRGVRHGYWVLCGCGWPRLILVAAGPVAFIRRYNRLAKLQSSRWLSATNRFPGCGNLRSPATKRRSTALAKCWPRWRKRRKLVGADPEFMSLAAGGACYHCNKPATRTFRCSIRTGICTAWRGRFRLIPVSPAIEDHNRSLFQAAAAAKGLVLGPVRKQRIWCEAGLSRRFNRWSANGVLLGFLYAGLRMDWFYRHAARGHAGINSVMASRPVRPCYAGGQYRKCRIAAAAGHEKNC